MFFENGSYIWLLILPIVSLVALLFAFRNNRKKAALLVSGGLNRSKTKTKNYLRNYSIRKITEISIITAVMILAVIAALKPVSDPIRKEINKEGSDIILIVDVSKSMLAEDLIPSRIERVKIELNRLLESADGDRIGLIVFSGSPVLKSPLTIDYGYLHSVFEDISVESVSRGGTEMSRALNYAMETGFDGMESSGKDIILITDGETHDSGAVEIARKIGDADIGLTIIGLGDPVNGTKIPLPQTEDKTDKPISDKVPETEDTETNQRSYLEFNGSPVLTKLNESLLKEMAQAAGGDYLSVSKGSFDLASIYRQLSDKRLKKSTGSMKITVYKQRYRLFLMIAVILMIAYFISEIFSSSTHNLSEIFSRKFLIKKIGNTGKKGELLK